MEILRSFDYILMIPADISEPVGKKILSTVDFIEQTYDRHTALITDTQRNRALRKNEKLKKLSNLSKDAKLEINKIQEDFSVLEGSDDDKRQASEIINRASEAANTSIKKLEI